MYKLKSFTEILEKNVYIINATNLIDVILNNLLYINNDNDAMDNSIHSAISLASFLRSDHENIFELHHC